VIRLPLVSRSVHIARVFLPSTIREDSQESCRPWCIPLRFHLIRLRLSSNQIGYLLRVHLIWTSPRRGQFFFHAALFRKGWPFAPTDVASAETLFNLLTLKPCTIRPRVTSRFQRKHLRHCITRFVYCFMEVQSVGQILCSLQVDMIRKD